MKPFLPLQQEFDSIMSSLSAESLLVEGSQIREEFLQVINRSDYLITVHDVEYYRPVCINDRMKHFYGFEHNILQGLDHFYYLKTIHISTYSALVESIAFFRRDQPGFLDLKYKLLNYQKEWETTIGTTKAIIRDKRNKPKIAITVMTAAVADAPPSLHENMALLTSREREIARCLRLGMTKKEIAEDLFISPGTVVTHTKNIYRKLGINKVSELNRLMEMFEV